jgi:hypothetical protein
MLKLVFSNYCDLSDNLYQTGWRQWLYFDTILSRPKYETQTRYDTSGTKIVYRNVEKRVNFDTGAIPEFISNVINLLPVFDEVKIYDESGNIFKCTNIVINNSRVNDCYVSCNIEFNIVRWRYDNCCRNYDVVIPKPPVEIVALGSGNVIFQANGLDDVFNVLT